MQMQMANAIVSRSEAQSGCQSTGTRQIRYSRRLNIIRIALELHAELVADTMDFFGDDAPIEALSASCARVERMLAELDLGIETAAGAVDDDLFGGIDSALAGMLAEIRQLSGHEVLLLLPEPGEPRLELGERIAAH